LVFRGGFVSRHRVVRQHVHDERFQHAGTDIVDYARAHGRNIGMAFGALVVILGGIYLFQTTSKGSEKAASMELLQAGTDYDQNLIEPAAGKLTQLLQRHGGTPSGTRARLLMGDIELRRGNPSAAEIQFRGFLSKTGSSDYIWTNGQRGLAVALENQSKFKEAAKAYEDLLKAPLGDEEKARALLDAGRAHSLGGDTAAAHAGYERIVKEFGTTRAAVQAKIHLAETGAGGTR
jgi:predicted negative regulator of RcsB-dependent stress response